MGENQGFERFDFWQCALRDIALYQRQALVGRCPRRGFEFWHFESQSLHRSGRLQPAKTQFPTKVT